jgi:hypothetical protein
VRALPAGGTEPAAISGAPDAFAVSPTENSSVLDDFVIRLVSRTAPGLLPGRALHRSALAAAAAGRYAQADERFEAAVEAYRRSLDVEALARLRVHQRMARARASQDPVREAEMMLEIVRGLNRLDRLESFHAPHELKDARSVLSEWLAGSESAFAADAETARAIA